MPGGGSNNNNNHNNPLESCRGDLEVMGGAQGLALYKLSDDVAVAVVVVCGVVTCPTDPYVQPNQRRSLPTLWDIIKL